MLLNCDVWRRFLRVPCIARRSNQSILKEISPGCSLEGLMLKLKFQYFGPLNRIMPGLPVHHQLPESTQTHAHRVSDAIQLPHPPSSPSPPAPNPSITISITSINLSQSPFPASGSFPMSQLSASGGQSTGVSASASVFPMNTQD